MSLRYISDDLLYKLNLAAKKGIVSDSDVLRLVASGTSKELISFVKSLFSLNREKIKSLWFEALESTFDLNQEYGVFRSSETALFFALLKNDGVLKQTQCRKFRTLHTYEKISDAAFSLMENKLIIKEKLNNEVIYFLDIEFYINVVLN